MVRALPALTILYLPESAAVQLTADCGLAGVKRVQCTGNVVRWQNLNKIFCDYFKIRILRLISFVPRNVKTYLETWHAPKKKK